MTMTETEREIELRNLEKRMNAARKAGRVDAVRKLRQEIKRLQESI